jgi:hypothetical protein
MDGMDKVEGEPWLKDCGIAMALWRSASEKRAKLTLHPNGCLTVAQEFAESHFECLALVSQDAARYLA